METETHRPLTKLMLTSFEKTSGAVIGCCVRQQLSGNPGWLCLSDSCHNENASVERGAGALSVLLECVVRLLLCVDV